MTFPMHSFRDLRHFTLSLILLVAFAAISGCGNNHSSSGSSSPPDWVVLPSGGQHAKSATRDYIAESESIPCMECHGADLSGGTSQVSCFENPAGCHHGPVSGWISTSPAAQNHGVSAKQAPGSSGFVSCQICHGRFFTGGAQVACLNAACHGGGGASPHPANWLPGDTFVHISTDQGNAPVCFTCHAGGANSPLPPPPAPDSGAQPGCFNSTLCHGAGGAPHPVGGSWVTTPPAAEPHGDSAKATPGVSSGFAYCQVCHGTGTDFAGGSSGVSCYTCHRASAPHPASWRTGDTYVHTSADPGNASVCAFCHLAGASSPIAPPPAPPAGTPPGCFNSTLCHGAAVSHLVPFLDPDHLGVNQADFDDFCEACHTVTGTSPLAGAPACTTCHGEGLTGSFTGKSPLTNLDCTSCHGDPPSSATYPNVAGKHAVHDALPGMGVCNPCHNGLDAGTLEHYDRANARPGKDALRVPPGDIAFLAEYNAKSGTADFSAESRTCSDVTCHGGQVTPDWWTSTANAIDVPNACLSCHVSGTTQYNSYFSGEHTRHITAFGLSAATCKQCHDATKVNVSGHFQNLSTPVFEQPASETILPDVRYNGNSCDPNKGGLTGCHKKEDW